ncbi:virulence plasmid B protein [Nitrosovibrio sp. Nv17]|nr:SpvB/TcaC N-terminal domain-containing protein [Nitrosovibrio sp. Nv17]SFW11613.1 virulence plasmid B protein [Nitrosovibrio sp. Nv17]
MPALPPHVRPSLAALALLAAVLPRVHAAVGTLDGTFAVSANGGATYAIPIAVPPGTAGLAPELALAYDSHAGNGHLGVGWSLSGQSAITRCGRTIVQDGVQGGVRLDARDRFCLDGQRLVAITGGYGEPGTEYRTEIDTFARIVSHGGSAGDPGHFKVWTKAGRILEYGNTADSRVEAQGKAIARSWALNRTSDTTGNYIAYTYTEDAANGEHYLQRIDYTGNASIPASPYNAVELIHEARPDLDTGYVNGSHYQTGKRLKAIRGHRHQRPGAGHRLRIRSLRQPARHHRPGGQPHRQRLRHPRAQDADH